MSAFNLEALKAQLGQIGPSIKAHKHGCMTLIFQYTNGNGFSQEKNVNPVIAGSICGIQQIQVDTSNGRFSHQM